MNFYKSLHTPNVVEANREIKIEKHSEGDGSYLSIKEEFVEDALPCPVANEINTDYDQRSFLSYSNPTESNSVPIDARRVKTEFPLIDSNLNLVSSQNFHVLSETQSTDFSARYNVRNVHPPVLNIPASIRPEFNEECSSAVESSENILFNSTQRVKNEIIEAEISIANICNEPQISNFSSSSVGSEKKSKRPENSERLVGGGLYEDESFRCTAGARSLSENIKVEPMKIENNYTNEEYLIPGPLDESEEVTSVLTCPHCGHFFENNNFLARHIDLEHFKSKIKYRCDYCLMEFLKKNCLRFHIFEAHHALFSTVSDRKQIKHNCKMCLKNSSTILKNEGNSNLTSYVHRFQGSSVAAKVKEKLQKLAIFTCDTCNKCYESKIKLAKHVKCHDVSRAHACPICPARFKERGDMQKHVRNHNENRPFQCSLCPSRFKRKNHLNYHILSHGDDRPFECQSCPAKFKTRDCLKSHMKCHEEARPLQCPICVFTCKRQQSLAYHMNRHRDSRPYQCTSCPGKFKSRPELKSHMRSHTENRPHQCPECPSKFKRKEHLKNHMLRHGDDRAHQCSICESKFKRQCDLYNHMQSHVEGRPYQCPQCPSKFKMKPDLSKHMVCHDESRPFQCPTCPLKFKRAGTLRMHLACHDDVWPHPCPQCPSKFKRKEHLKGHLLCHERSKSAKKEKPKTFVCVDCEEKFQSALALKKHAESHSDKQRENVIYFNCDNCKKQYTSPKTLATHVKRKHPAELPKQ